MLLNLLPNFISMSSDSLEAISSNSEKDSSPEKRKPDMKRSLNYSKINHNFEKGLKETVLWYKKHYTR